MPHSLFISDLHLSDDRPSTVELFLKFLEHEAIHAEHLYILGDLFDAWVGDDDDSLVAKQVKEGLAQLDQHGTKIHIMHGNRDFLIGDDFCQHSHVNLLHDPTSIHIADKAILLTHGDLLCTDDINYQQARELRVQQPWLDNFLKKDLNERKELAIQYRQQSGEAKSLLASEIMDVSDSTVRAWFDRYDIDLMIHGHTHRPDTHELRINGHPRERIVLDQWHDDEGMALMIDVLDVNGDNQLSIHKITIL